MQSSMLAYTTKFCEPERKPVLMRSHRNRFAWLRLHGLLGSLMLMAVSPAHATDRWFQLDRNPWFQG